jgi:hypothetical protein
MAPMSFSDGLMPRLRHTSPCMAKLDRLGWAAGLIFTTHGVRIGVRVTAPGLDRRLPVLLPPRSQPSRSSSPVVDTLYSVVLGGPPRSPGHRPYNLLYWNSARLARSFDASAVWDSLEVNLHFTVALYSPRRLFLHAGAVGWKGRAVLIPGRSWAGKSQLVATLVRAGAEYYSDEYAVLDDRGFVHPYAKPLYLRDESGEGSSRVPVAALGGRAGRAPIPVGWVVLTGYRPGAWWRPRLLTPGEALLELMNHNVHARLRPRPSLRILKSVALGARAWKGARGESAAMVGSLVSRLDATPLAPAADPP